MLIECGCKLRTTFGMFPTVRNILCFETNGFRQKKNELRSNITIVAGEAALSLLNLSSSANFLMFTNINGTSPCHCYVSSIDIPLLFLGVINNLVEEGAIVLRTLLFYSLLTAMIIKKLGFCSLLAFILCVFSHPFACSYVANNHSIKRCFQQMISDSKFEAESVFELVRKRNKTAIFKQHIDFLDILDEVDMLYDAHILLNLSSALSQYLYMVEQTERLYLCVSNLTGKSERLVLVAFFEKCKTLSKITCMTTSFQLIVAAIFLVDMVIMIVEQWRSDLDINIITSKTVVMRKCYIFGNRKSTSEIMCCISCYAFVIKGEGYTYPQA
uniref:Gustatory receptor n=1 Tax=Syphacia muris TaxID=451379 RepID=A0A0N5B0L5_9BILA